MKKVKTQEISQKQSDKIKKFEILPSDIIIFIAYYFDIKTLVRFSRMCKKSNITLHNKIFLRTLVKKYLTEHKGRMPPKCEIFRSIYNAYKYKSMDYSIENGYEKTIPSISEKFFNSHITSREHYIKMCVRYNYV